MKRAAGMSVFGIAGVGALRLSPLPDELTIGCAITRLGMLDRPNGSGE